MKRREPQREWWLNVNPNEALLRGRDYLAAKRMLDFLLVLLSLPAVVPVMLIIALLIKLESPDGPIIFTQLRTGKDGNRFKMLKFRTMVANAEEMKHRLAHLNELEWPDFKITNDPRITRIGRFLRKTSLDELPQLFNILVGQMSLVGPRPTSFAPETYVLWQTERLDVPPGLTGLWQVVGRGSMEFEDRVALDVVYVERRCLRLDLLILWHTVAAVFEGRGAV